MKKKYLLFILIIVNFISCDLFLGAPSRPVFDFQKPETPHTLMHSVVTEDNSGIYFIGENSSGVAALLYMDTSIETLTIYELNSDMDTVFTDNSLDPQLLRDHDLVMKYNMQKLYINAGNTIVEVSAYDGSYVATYTYSFPGSSRPADFIFRPDMHIVFVKTNSRADILFYQTSTPILNDGTRDSIITVDDNDNGSLYEYNDHLYFAGNRNLIKINLDTPFSVPRIYTQAVLYGCLGYGFQVLSEDMVLLANSEVYENNPAFNKIANIRYDNKIIDSNPCLFYLNQNNSEKIEFIEFSFYEITVSSIENGICTKTNLLKQIYQFISIEYDIICVNPEPGEYRFIEIGDNDELNIDIESYSVYLPELIN